MKNERKFREGERVEWTDANGVIKNGQIYLCKDLESFNDFMKECEKQGFKWYSGSLPTKFTPSCLNIETVGILLYIGADEDDAITWGFVEEDDKKEAIIYEKKKEEPEVPTILYVCDRKQCKECKDFCTHTTDITHATNFKNCGDGYYVEEEPTTGSLEMKIDTEQFEKFMEGISKITKKK